MESPNIPRGLALLRKQGFKFDIMSTSFFLSRRSHRDLRPDLDHAPGRDLEEVGGVVGVSGQRDEHPVFGYMESPNIPRGLALLRKQGFKFDIMSTSFFLSVPTSTTRPVGIWKKSVASLAFRASVMNTRSCHSEHPPRAGAAAQAGLQVRHHVDLVLPVAALDPAGGAPHARRPSLTP
jgi:hypothetical protein